ncbi:MAG: hypothetical protein ABH864_02305 [archaeon]
MFEKKMRNFDLLDISLTKLSVAAFVLFVLSIWPSAMWWVSRTDWWWFLIAFVVFAARPLMKWFR